MFFLFAALLTAALETAVFSFLFKEKLFLAYVFITNLLTNMVLNFLLIFVYLFKIPINPATLLLETCVVACEWALLYSFQPRTQAQNRERFFWLVLLANLLSYSAGIVL